MNRILRLCLISIFLNIWYTPLISQDLPKVIPPTPEAASLFKYLDYPVNYSTGIPQITVPLYEVRSGSISLPISLSYHSSGRKVYDETGAVGLGWTLMAGGMISRTMYGEADDNDNFIKFPSPWKKQADIDPTSDAGADFLEGVVATSYPIPWYDTEHDYFSYSANSISGKFILRDENNVKIPVLIPKKPYKIEHHTVTVQSNINYFDYINIFDDKGMLYRFGKSLKDGTEYHETSYGTAKTGWMLTEIISADKVDTIAFKYQYFVKTKRTISQKTVVTDRRGDCHAMGDSHQTQECSEDDDLGTAIDQTYGVWRLTEINFRNGKVILNLQTGSDLVSSIEVKNLKNQILRVIELNQNNQDALSEGNAPTKKLNFVIIRDQNSVSSEKYTFEYYPTVYNNSSVVNVRFRDLWGYYNASGQLMMRPVIENISCQSTPPQLLTIGDPSSIRTPSLSGTKSGVLKKITFPTGGSKEFIYEQNKYWDALSGQPKECGGLRLAQSIVTDGSGNALNKTYKYGLAESGYGVLQFVPNVSNMFFETKFLSYYIDYGGGASADYSYRARTYDADVLPIFSEFHNKPVYYDEVTEYQGTPTNNTGKTLYKYDQGNLFAAPNSVQGLFANSDLKHWKENSLVEKTDFKKVTSSYLRVKKIKNTYLETVYPNEKVWGLHAAKFFFKSPQYVNHPVNGSTPTYRYKWDPYCEADSREVFQFSDYTISIGKKELIRTVDSLFFDNGSTLATVTDYTYNTSHLLDTTSVLSSNNDILVTENKYPFDFLPTTVYAEMVNRNMLNFQVEVNSYKNLIPLSSTKTTFKDWGNNRIKPEIISVRQGTAPYEPRITFHSYDMTGNLQCVSKDNGPKISYIFGHKNELPIAEVHNASENQIYYNGFEDSDGNSTENDSKTGRKSRTGGYSKTITSLPNGTYNLTYFQKVAGAWNFVQSNNIVITNGTYPLNLTGQIDEIRFNPTGSTMSTYTYDTLVGVTSTTDTNNETTYFEFDGLGRLIIVKDSKKNILKTYTYHFKE